MGVFKLYFQIARWLSHQSTEILLSESLEQIAAQYTQYSYIGNRKTFRSRVYSEVRVSLRDNLSHRARLFLPHPHR